MTTNCKTHSQAKSTDWKVRQVAAKPKRCSQWHTLDSANRILIGRFAGLISTTLAIDISSRETNRKSLAKYGRH
ncbi:MAG: hypothetical protein A2Y12_11840 [Planctomycetes bacterium GWF2_42_9]|nr:MAG: hypothetical protein A2Y12_11840 [Planctomycetes bacterium GWF2_42_9]